MMPPVPEDMFLNAIRRVVRDNIEYVPPVSTNGVLYIRPMLFSSGPTLGLEPAKLYSFLVYVAPVAGSYYSDGFAGMTAMVIENFDRSAPLGMGCYKTAGNYAPCMAPSMEAKKRGANITLYLDPM
jgi:branched-chain amino acid aminotransferase